MLCSILLRRSRLLVVQPPRLVPVRIVAWPSVFLGGLAEVFKSSVWTLTYRELRALEGLKENSGELADPAASAA